MFEKLKIIENVKKVCSNNRTTFYLTKNNRIYQNELLIFEGRDNSDIRICKNDFYAFGDLSLNYLGDFENNTITKIDFVFSSECIWRNRAIINENYRYDISDGKIKADYFILDFDTKQKQILSKDLQGVIFCPFNCNKNAIYSFKTTLKSLSLLTGNYEWERDLPVQRIVQVIGIYEESLIITYESVENETGVIAIDVANGETIWDKTVEGMFQFYPLFSKKGDTIVNLHCGSFYLNGVQVAQSANVFTEINLRDGSIARSEVLTALDTLGLGVDKFTVEGDYIYFTATHQGSFGAVAVGVLDYDSLALLWWQVVEMQEADGFGNFLMNKPVVGGDKLYILDKTNVLHIFERTEA